MNYEKYIDKDPPMQSDGKSLLDYLAYIKEKVNFLFHNWSKSIRDAVEDAATAKQRTDGGYITAVTGNSIAYSSGLRYARAAITQAPDNSSGTAVGTTGFWTYKVTKNVSTWGAAKANARPIIVGTVYYNNSSVGYPAFFRFSGSAGAWNTLTVTVLLPVGSVIGNFTCECIMSHTVT